MRRFTFSVLIALLTLPVFAQQQVQAKVVLDCVAAAFRNAEGVKAGFDAKAFSKGRPAGETGGVIQLKGEKFKLETTDVITWFDGKTQWSYLADSDEVNVSNPTPAELQSLNPYALLQLYQHGYTCKLGAMKSFRGKPVYEVILAAVNRTQEPARMVVVVAKDTYRPLFITVEQRDKSRSEITITSYQTGQKYTDALFTFDKKQYPQAEIIDLR